MHEAPPEAPRPFFLPPDLDYKALPQSFQVAVQTFVQPLYAEVVLDASSALERAAGTSIVCLLFEELLEQFAAGREFADRVARQAEDTSLRDQELNRLLRIIAAKDKSIASWLRIRAARRKERENFRPAPKG